MYDCHVVIFQQLIFHKPNHEALHGNSLMSIQYGCKQFTILTCDVSMQQMRAIMTDQREGDYRRGKARKLK